MEAKRERCLACGQIPRTSKHALAYQARHKAEGLCRRCPNKADGSSPYCVKCKAKVAKYTLHRYHLAAKIAGRVVKMRGRKITLDNKKEA